MSILILVDLPSTVCVLQTVCVLWHILRGECNCGGGCTGSDGCADLSMVVMQLFRARSKARGDVKVSSQRQRQD